MTQERLKNLRTLYFQVEGKGVTNYSNDELTNSGLTYRLAKSIGAVNNQAEFKALSANQCFDIVFDHFSKLMKYDQIVNKTIADIYFIQYLNSPKYATRALQKALNKNGAKIDEDGLIGPKTIAALNKTTNENKFLNDFIWEMRLEYFNIGINNPSKFQWMKGWNGRLDKVAKTFNVDLHKNNNYKYLLASTNSIKYA